MIPSLAPTPKMKRRAADVDFSPELSSFDHMSPALLILFLICSKDEKKIILMHAERTTLTPRPIRSN
jgi:hypothetical protein